MDDSGAERRRGRRIELAAPVVLRRPGTPNADPEELVTKNVSLAGLYFETDTAPSYAVNQVVVASVRVPEPHRRDFPFTRLSGCSRVVRVSPLPAQTTPDRKRFGVALEFGEQLTALTATPHRG